MNPKTGQWLKGDLDTLLVTSPDEREALEREIRQRTDLLGSLLVGYHIQQALDAAPLQAEQVQLVSQWPKLLKYERRSPAFSPCWRHLLGFSFNRVF